MARVSDRGQMLLIGAVTIAILFLSLAFVLNGSLHTPTTAAEASDDVSAGEMATFHDAVGENTGTLIRRAIDSPNHTDSDEQWEYVRGNLSIVRENLGRFYAEEDRILDIGGHQIEGAEINQSIPHGQSNPVASDTRFRRFEIEAVSDDDFWIVVEDDDNVEWNVTFGGGGDDDIEVHEDSTFRSDCDASSGDVVDLANASIDGDHCNALDFYEQTEPPYSVNIKNGHNVTTDYVLIYEDTAGDILYGVDVTVGERSPNLHYNRTIRVAPGEPR